MRARGNLVIGTLIVILAVMLLPLVLKTFIPEFDWVFRAILIFGIYAFVRGFLGDSTLTLLVTGILVYFMAFKYADLFVSLWFVSLVLGLVSSQMFVLVAKDVLGFKPPGE